MIGHQSRVRIDIKSFAADPALRSTSPQRRQCYFYDENPLLYHKIYTRRSCERECDALYYYKKCTCIPLYLPKLYPNVTICDIKDFHCMSKVEQRIFNDLDTINCKADCLPSCYEISFYPYIFATEFQQHDLKESVLKNFSKSYAKRNFAFVHFYFPFPKLC